MYIDTVRITGRTSSISVNQTRPIIENPTHEVPTDVVLDNPQVAISLNGYIGTPPDSVLPIFHSLAVAPTGQPHYVSVYPFGLSAGQAVVGGQVVQSKFTYDVKAKGAIVSFSGELVIQAPQIGFGEVNDPGDPNGLILGGIDLGDRLGHGVFDASEGFSGTPTVYSGIAMTDDGDKVEGSGIMFVVLTEKEIGGSFTFAIEESSDNLAWSALKDYTTGALGTHEIDWTGQTKRYLRLSVTESNSATKAARFVAWAQIKTVPV